MESLDVILSAEESIGGFLAGGMTSSDINFKIILYFVGKGWKEGTGLGSRGCAYLAVGAPFLLHWPSHQAVGSQPPQGSLFPLLP